MQDVLDTVNESIMDIADWATRPPPPPSFREQFKFMQRKSEAMRMLDKYPGRVPVIVELTPSTSLCLDKKKYLVPTDTTLGQFMFVIRKRMQLHEAQALFLFISDEKILGPTSMTLSAAYAKFKDPDNFLYVELCEENTFGADSGLIL